MIRAVCIASLVTLLVLVLYLPSAYPPDRFLAHMRAEHALNDSLWGHEPALRILGRALAIQTGSAEAPLAAANAAGTTPTPVDVALAAQISTATARLFGNPYFRSAEALVTLALCRVSALLEWLHVLPPFLAAALFDGAMRRTVKSKEFRHHDPEAYGISGLIVFLMFCVTTIAFVLPVTLHPYLVAAAPVAVGLFGSIAIANFHARG